MNYEKKFWDILEDLFAGAELEGKSGYINLLKVKRKYFKNYLKPNLLNYINEKLEHFPKFKEELYDKLYSFFHRYFSESGSIYFSYTPLYYKIYEKVYHNDKVELKELITYNTDYEQIISDKEDVSLFWKTHMLYYIKTDKIIRSMKVDFLDENLFFYFDASEIELKKANEKKELIYELKEIKDDLIILKVIYSERGKKTKFNDILKKLKKKYKNITEDILKKAIRTFEKQSNVDYFINKNAEKFLKEQFDLWMYQYLFSQEADFNLKRFNELQALKDIAYKIMEFISQFENELKKIWEKPRLVFNSNYVISLDRLAKKENGIEIIKEIVKELKQQEKEFKSLKDENNDNTNFKNQIEEWYALKIIDDSFNVDEILQNDKLNERYQYLPIDTKYFNGLKEKIESLFNVYDINGDLDGRLIKSENWQALNTILPRYKEEIQIIYIDPPFNTGDDFDYIDKFQDSTWLTLMENRLTLARNLLNERGNLFLHLDENADHRGKEILSKFFKNIKEIIWNTNATKDENSNLFSYKSFGMSFTRQHDIIFQAFKNENNKFFKIWKINNKKLGWLDVISTFSGNIRNVESFNFFIEKYRNNVLEDIIIKLNDNEKIYPIGDIWNDIYSFMQSEMRVSEGLGFRTQKPENLLRRIIQATTEVNDLVLDFFMGSGTTIAVAHKLNRKYIGIEVGNYFNEIWTDEIKITNAKINEMRDRIIKVIKEGKSESIVLVKKLGILGRMKNVIYGDLEFDALYTTQIRRPHLTKDINWQGGGFFKYYELEQYEDILKTIDYADTDLKEYYEKLREVLKNDFNFSKANPFIFDKKLAKAVKIKDDKIEIDFKSLYPDKEIDIREILFLQKLEENEKNILKLLYLG